MTRAILILVCLFLLWLLLFWEAIVFGAEVDLPLLRDVTCTYESRGLDDPDDAVGMAGEIGRCQIRVTTARHLGYKGKNRTLFDPVINRAWAIEVFRYCQKRGWRTVVELAHCYNAGPRASFRRTHYVRDIAIRYAEAVRDRQWRKM